jgi:excisionase family DNA binding protein
VTVESSTLDVMTVAQASLALGIHPTQVRLLVRRGDLAGERLGSQWVIPRSELERFSTRKSLAGRLFSQRIAWSVVALLQREATPWTLTREEQARVRSYVERPLRDLSIRLGGRGRSERLSVGPGGLERLDGGPRWIRSATSRADGRSIAYTTESDLDAFLEGSNAVVDTEQPNLILRVVADRWWPFPPGSGGALAWSTVLELDRYDAGEITPDAGE